jgi:hypothetical protein
MNFLSISTEVGTIAAGKTKKYVNLYPAHGYEMGFGIGGTYNSHGHLCYLDLLFSPGGIEWSGTEFSSIEAKLLIVPPRTQVPNLQIGHFFFLKFCPEPDELKLPDKVDRVVSDTTVLYYSGAASLTFPWYARCQGEKRNITVKLLRHSLSISFAEGRTVVIRE